MATAPVILPASAGLNAASDAGPTAVPEYVFFSVATTSPPWFVKNVRVPAWTEFNGQAHAHALAT